MFDKIKSLEKKSVKSFKFIEKFIKNLEDSRDKAVEIKLDSNYQITRLKAVIKTSDTIRSFSEKLLKAIK